MPPGVQLNFRIYPPFQATLTSCSLETSPMSTDRRFISRQRGSRPAPARRRALRPLAEMLEERLAPAVSPLEMPHAATAAVARAGADPAVVAWLNDVAGVVLNTSIRPAFVSQL